MRQATKAFVLASLMAPGLLSLLGFWALRGFPEPAPSTAQADSINVQNLGEQAAVVDFTAISAIFPNPRPSLAPKKNGARNAEPPSAAAAESPMPILRYLGAVSGADGQAMYYLMDDKQGRLVKIGPGKPSGEIRFVSAQADKMVLTINGKELYVTK